MKNIGVVKQFKLKLYLSIGSIEKKQELYKHYMEVLNQTGVEQEKEEITHILEDITASILNDSDENKIKYFSKINVDYLKLRILGSLKNVDDMKIAELISQLPNDDLKMRALINIKNSDILMQQFLKLNSDERTFQMNSPTLNVIMERLETDEQKIAFLRKWPMNEFSIFDDAFKSKIILGMEESYVLEALDYIVTKMDIIPRLHENIRIKAIDKLDSDIDKASIISSLSPDYEEQKADFLKEIKDDRARGLIIESMQDENAKLDLLSTLQSDVYKNMVLETISTNSVTSFIKENSKCDDVKTLLKYASLDDQILEIIANTYSLDKNQQLAVKDLYKKNNDLLRTIKYKILDKKYSNLNEKLSLITCYPDIQERICELDDNSLQVLFKTLKIYDEKDIDWISITDKIVNNLYSEEYKDLSNDISKKKLSEEQLEQVCKILSKKNYFNISNLEEVDKYEEIERSVLDNIINKTSQEQLKQYQKIMEMKDDERVKFAVLMSVYGQSLTDAKKLVEQYAMDINNLEITEQNEQFVKYIYSLRTILETDDLDILRQIYEDSKTMPKMEMENLDRIAEGLNDAYLETYNKKLFKTDEKNFLGVTKTENGEVKVYDAGTEFSISLSSIGAYHTNNEREEYREDWNRPQIASQGFCTSYIRNDMLATAHIKNVVYGFTDYDRGTLMAASPKDMSSDAARFRPIAKREVKFLTENTMINESEGCLQGNYNEMLFNRNNKDGTRKQPSYVVFIKTGNEQEDKKIWQNSLKAAEDFNIPIVIVDKQKCAEAEMQKIQMMADEYAETRDNKTLQAIVQKFGNNFKGNGQYFSDELWKSIWDERGIKGLSDWTQMFYMEKGKSETKRDIEVFKIKDAVSDLDKRTELIFRAKDRTKGLIQETVELTKETTRTGEINEQVQLIKSIEKTKMKEQEYVKEQ